MMIISRGGEGEDDISVDECIGGAEDDNNQQRR